MIDQNISIEEIPKFSFWQMLLITLFDYNPHKEFFIKSEIQEFEIPKYTWSYNLKTFFTLQ